MTERARTIFLGSGSFAVPIAEALAHHQAVNLIAVVTAPTRRGSRGRPTDPPVADWAMARGLPMLRPARLREPETLAAVAALEPELLVLADYGQIVPPALLELPVHGALNLHPSLLPRHRGASPIPATILAGDSETGVSLMRMDAGLDTGPLIAQAKRPLSDAETAAHLEAQLSLAAASLLAQTLRDWIDGSLGESAQPAEGATITRPLSRADGRIDPRLPAFVLERQVRAYQPWPGSYIDPGGGRIKIWRAALRERHDLVPPGTLVRVGGDGIGLTTSDGILELLEVQPAGGRRMSGADLLRGRPELVGPIVTEPSAAGRSASG